MRVRKSGTKAGTDASPAVFAQIAACPSASRASCWNSSERGDPRSASARTR